MLEAVAAQRPGEPSVADPEGESSLSGKRAHNRRLAELWPIAKQRDAPAPICKLSVPAPFVHQLVQYIDLHWDKKKMCLPLHREAPSNMPPPPPITESVEASLADAFELNTLSRSKDYTSSPR